MRDGIVTGEGVVLDLRPASFASRMLGIALDLVVLFLVGLAAVWLGWELTLFTERPVVTIVALVAVTVAWPAFVETLTRGKSLGKWAAGIRVVRDDGGPVRFRHAFIRSMVGVGELWLTGGAVALFASLANDRGKRLGDMLAGTYVIRTRGASVYSATIVMPPPLAGWAAHADMRRLPDGLALAARQFLARATKLEQGSRARLGTDLAGRIEQYVAPGPPPGTPPESFIMAVLAARRDREWARTQRERTDERARAATLHRLPYAIQDPPR